MNEKQVFEKIIEEDILQKEAVRMRVINTVQNKNNKGVLMMKRKVLISLASVFMIATISFTSYAAVDAYEYGKADSFLGKIGIEAENLSRNEAKRVYKDIQSESFSYPVTKEVLKEKADQMGINTVTVDGKDLYAAIKDCMANTYTAKITTQKILEIQQGIKYQDIISYLGVTKDIGKDGQHLLLYAVDGEKVLYLAFQNETDICPMSGAELVKTLIDASQQDSTSEKFNATLQQKTGNSILVLTPNFKDFDIISLSITDKTEIEFSDGKKATIEDIQGDLIITTEGGIRESYPPQGTAKKIIIK